MAMQKITNEEWEFQLIEYMLGTMDTAESAVFEEELNSYEERTRLAREYRETVGLLGASVPAAEPPAGHHARFMQRVAATPQEETSTSRRPLAFPAQAPAQLASTTPTAAPAVAPPAQPAPVSKGNVTDMGAFRERKNKFASFAWAAAAAAMILIVGAWGWTNKVRVDELQTAFNIPPGYIAVPVAARGEYEGSRVVSFINPQTNEIVLVGQDMKPIPADRAFELWWLPEDANQAPVPAGVFTADGSGNARHSARAPDNVADYRGVAITVEPREGVPAPTGDIVFLGTYD